MSIELAVVRSMQFGDVAANPVYVFRFRGHNLHEIHINDFSRPFDSVAYILLTQRIVKQVNVFNM